MQNKLKMSSSQIIAGMVIIAVVIIAIFFTFNTKQTESDCSKAETYDSVDHKCVVKSGQDYKNEIQHLEEAQAKAEKENNRRTGKSCIPASEAMNYVGVDGCVTMYVSHAYIAPYGWAWLDSGNSESDFSISALSQGIITRADADYYLGKYIAVRGEIVLYDGAPEIHIANKDAIFSVKSEAERIQDAQNFMKSSNERFKELQSQCTWETNAAGLKVHKCPETQDDKRANCFNERIKNAKTKAQKNEVYEQCKNP